MQKMKDVCQVVYKKEDHMYIWWNVKEVKNVTKDN